MNCNSSLFTESVVFFRSEGNQYLKLHCVVYIYYVKKVILVSIFSSKFIKGVEEIIVDAC